MMKYKCRIYPFAGWLYMAKARLIPYRVGNVTSKPVIMSNGIQMIKARDLWDEGEMGKDVTIAVLDTGCQIGHPDLKNNIIGGINFSSEYSRKSSNVSDKNGHGTHVAGTIASTNDSRVLGVAPLAKLLIVKVLSNDGTGEMDDIVRGIYYAINWRGPLGQRVRIISMSLGTTTNSSKLHSAIKSAVNNNILVVCAAGNRGDGDPETEEKNYPGSYSEVVQVGAIDSRGRIAQFSNTNDEIDIVAPGVDILSTYPQSKYARLSGTSMATPHVAGAAALIINQCERDFNRKLSEAEIYAQLCKRTKSLGYSKSEEGNGLIYLTKEY